MSVTSGSTDGSPRPFFDLYYTQRWPSSRRTTILPRSVPPGRRTGTSVRRYLTAVPLRDSLWRVRDDLGREAPESTVVIGRRIHGMEFDERGRGYGHGTASASTRCIHPWLLAGRGGRRGAWGGDVPQTTMRRCCWGAFGCANPAADTRAGRILLGPEWRLIAAELRGLMLDRAGAGTIV